MKKHLLNFVNKFVKAIELETASIFAGAGLSVSSGLVNWKELLREIAEELDLDVDKETDLISLAQYYQNEKGGRGAINTKLIEQFTKDANLNENHKILASLPIHTYWTTNYDKLIENALEQEGKIVDTKLVQKNLSVNIPRRDVILYKMHGDISLSHEAVLTKDDYERYNEKRKLFSTTLQGELVSKTFLFIGFSFEDPNLDYILSRVRILLGEHIPEHFCFMKSIDKKDYENSEDFSYDEIKQKYRINDLKRFGIQTLIIDDYDEIKEVLKLIQIKIKRKNIFISGAAHEYGHFQKLEAENLIFNFSKMLAKNNYRIISGFGLGVGSSVINGTLSFMKENKKNHLDEYLIMRPFPQNIIDPATRDKEWNNYRKLMLNNAGIAVFFFGNKLVDDKIIKSDGLEKEFNIACEFGIKVIPVGCTGYVSEELWNKVYKDFEKYYPENSELKDAIKILGQQNLTEEDIIENLIKSINLLQNNL